VVLVPFGGQFGHRVQVVVHVDQGLEDVVDDVLRGPVPVHVRVHGEYIGTLGDDQLTAAAALVARVGGFGLVALDRVIAEGFVLTPGAGRQPEREGRDRRNT